MLTKSLLHPQQTKHDAETTAAVPADGTPTLFPGGPHMCKGSRQHPAPTSYVQCLKRGGIAGADRKSRPSIKRRKPLPWAAPLTKGLKSPHPLTDRP